MAAMIKSMSSIFVIGVKELVPQFLRGRAEVNHCHNVHNFLSADFTYGRAFFSTCCRGILLAFVSGIETSPSVFSYAIFVVCVDIHLIEE